MSERSWASALLALLLALLPAPARAQPAFCQGSMSMQDLGYSYPCQVQAASFLGPMYPMGPIEFAVEAYGAKCDGVTDDSAAITTTINLAVAFGAWATLPSDGRECLFSTPISVTTASPWGLKGSGRPNNSSTTGVGSKLRFAPAGATYAFTLNGNNSANVTFQDFALQVDSPAAGAIDYVDPVRFITFDRVYLNGYSTGAGVAFNLDGQTSCNCFHDWKGVQVRNFGIGWRFSGFANANHVEDSHCSLSAKCFSFEPTGSDTVGGTDNKIERTEINGTVTVAIALTASDRNAFDTVVSDGGGTLTIDANSDHNYFENSSLPNQAVTTAILANQTFVATNLSSNMETHMGMQSGLTKLFQIDGPETCVATLGGAYYQDASLKKFCICDGTALKWYREDTGEWGSNTSCGTTDAKYVYVWSYGALCDGSNDDTAGISAAITAVDSNNGVVRIPATPNGCRITTPLTIPSGVTIAGDSIGGSDIRLANSFVGSAGIAITGGSGQSLRNLRLVSNLNDNHNILSIASASNVDLQNVDFIYNTTGTGTAIDIGAGTPEVHLTNVRIRNPGVGITINTDNGLEFFFRDVIIENPNSFGLRIARTTATDTGAVYLSNVKITNPLARAGSRGFTFTSTAANTAMPIFMSECVADGALGAPSLDVDDINGLYLGDNSWFANGALAAANLAGIRLQDVSGFYMAGGRVHSASRAFDLRGADLNGRISGVAITAPSATAINIDAAASLSDVTFILNNYVASNITNDFVKLLAGAGSSPMSSGGGLFFVGGGSVNRTLALRNVDVGSTNINKYLRVGATGTLEVINSTFATVVMQTTDAGEVSILGVSGDGSGKVVCIKSDGFLGTCSSVVAAGGTCTCG